MNSGPRTPFFRFRRGAAVLAASFVLLAPAARSFGQLAGKGTIQGIVSGASGAVIPNAKIVIRDVLTGTQNTQHSAGSGFYSVGGFDPGTYDITVTAAGFQSFTQKLAARFDF